MIMNKTGRNEPCPCGSGKKYKYCCVANEHVVDEQSRRNESHSLAVSFERAFHLHQQGQHNEAGEIYRDILQKQPDHDRAMHYLGVLAYQTKQYELAEELISKSISIAPRIAKYYCNYGLLLIDLERYQQVVECQQMAIQLNPNYAEPYLNLSAALFKLGRYAESALNARKAIERNPLSARAFDNLGIALRFLHEFDASIKSHESAIQLEPTNVAAYVNLAATYLEIKDLAAVNRYCMAAIRLDPNHAHAYMYLGLASQELGNLEQAKTFMQHALTLTPADELIRWNLSLIMLSTGNLEVGWKGYEARWRLEQLLPVCLIEFPYPWWQGEEMPDKTILIWWEQGIGDQIMFANMYYDVIARFKLCIVACPKKLMPLLARSFPLARFVCKDDTQQLDGLTSVVDVQSALGSLARWLRPTVAAFPKLKRFLVPDANRLQHWKDRLAELGPGLKVGICWRSGNTAGGRQFYCTQIEQWAPIFAVRGVHFINLQYDECSAELARAKEMMGVTVHHYPEVDLFDDLDETAALTGALDLVIAIPTTSAILAAAIGVDSWMLSSGFTWQKFGTAENCWYTTATHLQRRWDQPWEVFLAKIATALGEAAQFSAKIDVR